MKRINRQLVVAQVVGCSALMSLGFLILAGTAFAGAPAAGASGSSGSSGSIGGVVRDMAGTPQMGISIELLRGDSTVVARAFTDGSGKYSIASVLPGQYALKAMGGSFIPALKQNLRVRTHTLVNMTLNNVYDLMQLAAPVSRRPRAQSEDDWAWTLRSAASRPLLRWLDDGSPILVSDGSAETSRIESRRNGQANRKVRASIQTGGRQFGAGSHRVALAMQQENSARRRTAASAGMDAGTDSSAGMMDAMLGFRQEMANSGLGSSSVQTVAAVMADPLIGSGSQQGLQAASLRTWESLELVNSLQAEAGSDQVVARLGDGSVLAAALPFASLTLRRGANSLEYRVATAHGGSGSGGESSAEHWLPVLSERDGALMLEHGLHQELGWSTSAGSF